MELTNDDAETLRGYAELDWLVSGRWDRLHAPVEASYDPIEWRAEDVTFACGWQVRAAYIPGVFSRLGTDRCSRCCRKTGLPPGTGSPKNDDECRRILGVACCKVDQSFDGDGPLPTCVLPTGHDGDHDFQTP